MVGVRFQTNIPEGGNIQCKALELPTDSNTNYTNNDYALFNINTNLQCTPIPKNEFNSISEPTSDDFPFSGLSNENKEIVFNLTQFGTIRAGFEREVQKTPGEQFQETLETYFGENGQFFYSFIVAAIIAPIVGWLLPHAIINKKRKDNSNILRHTYH